MPDVTELLDELAGLPERPPAAPRPVTEIRHAARRRRTRRRLQRTGFAATVLAVVALAGVALLRHGDEGGPDVDTGPVAPVTHPEGTTGTTGMTGMTGTTVTDDATARATGSRGMSISPSEGFDDGQRVTLAFEMDPGGRVQIMQCAAERLDYVDASDHSPEADGWCGSVFELRGPAGLPDLTFLVSRYQPTRRAGLVDCATAPGRCLLVARVEPQPWDRTQYLVYDRYTPLVFRDDLGPLPEPNAELVDADGPIEDGQVVRVEGEGFARRSGVQVAQCNAPVEELVTAGDDEVTDRCDVRREVWTETDEGGAVAVDLRIFHDIGIADPTALDASWQPCTPCSLLVRGTATRNVALPLDLVPTDDPIRPAMHVTPAPPYRLDQQVRVEGSGFQVRTDVAIGTCASPLGNPPSCAYPDQAFTTTDGQGAFAIAAYPLDTSVAGLAVCDTATPCVLSWERDGVLVGSEVPLDLSG
jgi:hypothetical protein